MAAPIFSLLKNHKKDIIIKAHRGGEWVKYSLKGLTTLIPLYPPLLKGNKRGLAIASLSLAMTGKEIGGAYGTLRGY